MDGNFYKSTSLKLICLLALLVTTPVATSAQQNQKNKPVTITSTGGNMTLKQVFLQIEQQTGWLFVYDANKIDVNKTISGNFINKSVADVLNSVLESQNISYKLVKDNIVLSINEAPVTAMAKQHVIKGRVVDATTKEPILGASVWLKDTALGTTSDAEGNYTLRFTGNYAFVNFSFLGYDPQEIRIRDGVTDVALTPSSNTVEDVVVVAYGAQKKASIIGSISSVMVNDIKTPVAKISSSLAGRLSGVISVNRSGEPGVGSTFWIRGISTFGANATPLVLVDGIERDLDLVDTEDIKEFSILKDASATAVYGVRGANGVVLITTRTGQEGKPKVSVKIEGGLLTPTKIPEMLNSVQFAEMYNDASGSEIYNSEAIEKYRNGIDPDLYPNINWTNQLYKDFATNQRVNVNVTGGGSTANYYIAGAYYGENGLFSKDNLKEYNSSVFYRRFNFRSNVDVKLFRYTTLNVNLSTSFERKNMPGTSSGAIWDYAIKTSPNAYPLRYSDGTLAGMADNQGANPYVLLTQTGYQEQFWNTAQSLFGITQDLGEWITPGLKANVKASFDAKNANLLSRTKTPEQWLATGRDEDGKLIKTLVNPGQESLYYSEGRSGKRTIYLEASLTYDHTFAEKHNVGAMFLFQQSQKNYTGVYNSEAALPYRNQGIAGRVTYDYDNRYFIEANCGYNGSENFSPGHRFGFFPAIAAGWVVSNEKFFKNWTNVVDMLKLKASYGLVGNDQIGGGRRFIYNETIKNSGNYYFGTDLNGYSGIQLGEWANPNVGWEESRKFNAGIEFSLFGLKIQADYFTEKRSGIFLQRESLPTYMGMTTKPWVNIGKMNNSGVDASLEYYKTIGEVRLTGRFNFTYARNKIMNQDQPEPEYKYMDRTGQARYQRFGYIAAGLFKDQADIDSWPQQMIGSAKPGDIKYFDLNGDGVVNTYDTKAIGYPDIPEIVYGLGASATWRSWDLSVFFQGVGHVSFSIRNPQTQAFTGRNIREANVFSDVYGNYWSESNPNVHAKYPRLSIGTNLNNNENSTFWMVDGSYIRMKNIEIGYTLPKRVANKLHMDGFRVYLSGVNLLTFSKFKLWDPDLQTGATDYPNNRVYNLGFSLIF